MPSQPLSSKAMGKRPMANPKHHLSIRTTSSRVDTPSELNDDADEWASASGASASSRRVQPARARRGVAAGSLVGTNDVDKRLLDTLRRKGVSLPYLCFGFRLIMTLVFRRGKRTIDTCSYKLHSHYGCKPSTLVFDKQCGPQQTCRRVVFRAARGRGSRSNSAAGTDT